METLTLPPVTHLPRPGNGTVPGVSPDRHRRVPGSRSDLDPMVGGPGSGRSRDAREPVPVVCLCPTNSVGSRPPPRPTRPAEDRPFRPQDAGRDGDCTGHGNPFGVVVPTVRKPPRASGSRSPSQEPSPRHQSDHPTRSSPSCPPLVNGDHLN